MIEFLRGTERGVGINTSNGAKTKIHESNPIRGQGERFSETRVGSARTRQTKHCGATETLYRRRARRKK